MRSVLKNVMCATKIWKKDGCRKKQTRLAIKNSHQKPTLLSILQRQSTVKQNVVLPFSSSLASADREETRKTTNTIGDKAFALIHRAFEQLVTLKVT